MEQPRQPHQLSTVVDVPLATRPPHTEFITSSATTATAFPLMTNLTSQPDYHAPSWSYLLDNLTSLQPEYHVPSSPSLLDDRTSLQPEFHAPPQPSEPSILDKLFTFSNEDVLSFRQTWRYFIYFFLPVGAVLSLCNVLVFRHRRMRSSSAATYIIALNAIQVFYIGLYASDVALDVYLPDHANNYIYLTYAMFVGNYLAAVTLRSSFLLMCVLSLERLYAVLRPLHVKNFILSQRPLLVSLTSFAVTAVWHVYLHAKYRVAEIPGDSRGNSSSPSIYVYQTTWLYQRTAAVNDGFSLAAKVIFTLGTLVVRLVLSLLTIWALRRHNLATASSLGGGGGGMTTSTTMSSSSFSSSSTATPHGGGGGGVDDAKRKREVQMTVSVLTASLASVVLFTPAALHFVFGVLFPEMYGYRAKYSNFYYIMANSSSLAHFYFAVDFLCFVGASSNYRAVLGEYIHRVLGWGQAVLRSGGEKEVDREKP